MKPIFSTPKVSTYWIAVGLGALGILAYMGTIPGISEYAFWLEVAGVLLLALGNVFTYL